jgi:hypothetical protein
VYRFSKEELPEQLAMSKFALGDDNTDEAASVRKQLFACCDGIGFWPAPERDDMSWPLVIAVAATLAQPVDMIIKTSEYGWFIPSDDEVRNILE